MTRRQYARRVADSIILGAALALMLTAPVWCLVGAWLGGREENIR